MRNPFRKGISFGLTSGVITTMGLMIGLGSGAGTKTAVLGGILTIAVADAFSDALGIHISEEAEHQHTEREIWESTLSTFFAKLFFALTFVVPILLTSSLQDGMIVSIIWGMSLLILISYKMARDQKVKARGVIAEHLTIAIVVILAAYFIGSYIADAFPA